MRAALARFLHKAWYTNEINLWYLSPLMVLFVVIARLRSLAFKLGVFEIKSVSAPIIVVGNITVGGTGKTPLVIAIANYLKSKGYKPGVVSRGYGGGGVVYPQLVNAHSLTASVGDEALLIYHHTKLPVVVDPVRSRGVELLVANDTCNVIISDDGLQHLAMYRDIEVVVIDGERLLGNGQRLPLGPLRESKDKLNEVDFIVYNGDKSDDNELPEGFTMLLETKPLQALPNTATARYPQPPDRVHAVAAIGNPERFFESLKKLGFSIIPHAFEDHHFFQESELEFGDDLAVVMTEKDAVKCQSFKNDKLLYLPVEASLPEAFFEEMNRSLIECSGLSEKPYS